MKAELKRVHSPDVENFSTYWPDDVENFCFLLQAMIGPEGMEGEESFDIEVCTPKRLASTYDKHDVIIGRHLFIVFEYDYDRIIATINKFISNCSGDSWKEMAEKISRLGKWEFEDYSE